MCNLQEHIERCERAKAAGGVRDEVASALRFADYGPEGWSGAESLADALMPIIERVKAEAKADGWDEAVKASRYSYENTRWFENPYRAAIRAASETEGNDHD